MKLLVEFVTEAMCMAFTSTEYSINIFMLHFIGYWLYVQ